jgi:hypothetical protein
LLAQNPVFLAQVLDGMLLVLVHPAGDRDEQELKGIEYPRLRFSDCRNSDGRPSCRSAISSDPSISSNIRAIRDARRRLTSSHFWSYAMRSPSPMHPRHGPSAHLALRVIDKGSGIAAPSVRGSEPA